MPLVPASDDDFATIRDQLCAEFGQWLEGRHGTTDTGAVVSDADIFLAWRFHYSTGVLDAYDEADIGEFLLGWCPRKLSAPPEAADGICRALSAFVEFLADTGRLRGGFDRAARLMTYTEGLIPAMRTRMADPANFGMAKSLFFDLDQGEALTEDELKDAVQARMDEFNTLPFEQRKAATDRFFDPQPELLELPFTYLPPSPTEVQAAALAAALPRKVEALRDYLGAGKPLTQKGNLKLADGRALVELLDTGDRFDPQHGGTTFKTTSTEHLPGLNFFIDVAKRVRAVRVYQRRLVPVQAWGRRSTVDQAVALARLVVEGGPLTLRGSRYRTIFDLLDELLDAGIVHWLAPLLAHDTEVEFDRIVDVARVVVDEQFGEDDRWRDTFEAITEKDVSRIFTTLEAAGVIEWVDTVAVATRWDDSYPAGGVVRLTALGRHVIADLVPDAGYVLTTVGDLADADGAALIDALGSVSDDQHPAVLAAWQPGRSTPERAEMIVTAIADADTAVARLVGFVALERFEPETVAPLVRQLLDSPAAGHAALWLVSHGLADDEAVGDFVTIGVVVDVLAAALDDPDELCRLFTGSLSAEELSSMLDDMWRHPAAETGAVLDALGEHLPDAKLAKAARKAAMRHRSWMANRG